MWADELVQTSRTGVSQARHRAPPEGAGEEHRGRHLPEARGTQGRAACNQGPAPDNLPRRGTSPGRHLAGAAGRARRVPDTLPSSYQSLLNRYELRDAAIKVVGIGSVGTSCWVFLFTAGESDPLFLQIKEARASILEPCAGASVFPNQGQRIVHGHRLMQPASDIFLGWSRGPRRDFFVRQLRDIKIGVRVETFGRAEIDIYATWCGRAFALSHARSGNPACSRLHGQERRHGPGHRRVCGGVHRPE